MSEDKTTQEQALTPEEQESKARAEEIAARVAEQNEKQAAEKKRIMTRIETEFLPLLNGETEAGAANIHQALAEVLNQMTRNTRENSSIEWNEGDTLEGRFGWVK